MSSAIQDIMNSRHPRIQCPQGSVQPASSQIVENPYVWIPLRHIKIIFKAQHLTPSYVTARYALVYLIFYFLCQIRVLQYSLRISKWGQQNFSHKKWCAITHIDLKLWLPSPEKGGGSFIPIPKADPLTFPNAYLITSKSIYNSPLSNIPLIISSVE